MSFLVINDKIAIEPVTKKGATAKMEGGFAILQQSTDVILSTIVFDSFFGQNEVVRAGDKVMLPGDSEQRAWNLQVLTHDGKPFVLVPIKEVIAVTGN